MNTVSRLSSSVSAKAFSSVLATLAFTTIASSASAAPLEVTMSFSDPGVTYSGDQQPLNAPFTIVLSYNFEPHTWSDVALTLELPNKVTHPRIAIGTRSESGSTFGSSLVTAGASDTISWVGVPASNTGISGQILVQLTAEAWASGLYGPSIDGTPYTFTARLTGTSEAGANTSTAVGTRTGVGRADPTWQYVGGLYSSPQNKAHETTGEPGVLMQFNYRVHNCGTNPTVPLSTVTIQLGSALQVARHWVGGNGGVYPNEVDPTLGSMIPPGNNAEIWSTTPGTPTTVMATHPKGLNAYPSCDYTGNYYLEIWASCATLADLATARANHADLSPWQFQGTPSFLEPHFGGADTPTDHPGVAPVITIESLVCGADGAVSKSGDHSVNSPNNVSLGARKPWSIYFSLPTGVPSVQDFAFVDVLPMRGTETYFGSNAALTDRGLAPYFCTLEQGLYFAPSAMPGYISSGACKPARTNVPYYWYPDLSQPFTTVSHFVLYGNYMPVTTDNGIGLGSLYSETYVPVDFDTGTGPDFSVIRNRSYVMGKADLDFNPQTPATTFGDAVLEVDGEDPYEDDGSAFVIDYACPESLFKWDASGPLILGAGDCALATFYLASAPAYRNPKNLSFQVDVPDGIQIVSTNLRADICLEDPDGAITTPAAPWSDPLTWQLGEPGADCSMRTDSSRVEIVFCADGNHAFENGEVLDFTLDILGSESEPPPGVTCGNAAALHSVGQFTMLVPGEMSETVAPLCADNGSIGFRTTALNSGGMDLTQLVPSFELPRIADGSSADAIFMGVTNIVTGGQPYVIEYSNDGTAWVGSAASGDPAVRYVRLRGTGPSGLGIEAITGSPIHFDVITSTLGTSGAELFGAGALDGLTSAGALPTVNAIANQPYVVDGCKTLTVTKFFDADGDRTDDGLSSGEGALAGWTFSVVNEDGAEVAVGTTDGAGATTFLLPIGTYTVTEHANATPPATWSITTPADAVADGSATVTLTLGSDEALHFGNRCACPDGDANKCTGRCMRDGTCDDAFTVACSDNDSCSADSCNPATGVCGFVPKACDAIDYYIAIENAAGAPIGTVHCVLEPGEAPACDMDAGVLRVYPLGTPSIQTCVER